MDRSSKNSVALSPQANYTDWVTATCRRNLVPTFVSRWVSRGIDPVKGTWNKGYVRYSSQTYTQWVCFVISTRTHQRGVYFYERVNGIFLLFAFIPQGTLWLTVNPRWLYCRRMSDFPLKCVDFHPPPPPPPFPEQSLSTDSTHLSVSKATVRKQRLHDSS
jgi:hypothetical protein